MTDHESKPCICHTISQDFCAMRAWDPFWCRHRVQARKDAAKAAGQDESMAAIGGPFVIPNDVPPDAHSVDNWLTRLARR